jgi:hypothetical protein
MKRHQFSFYKNVALEGIPLVGHTDPSPPPGT